MPIQIFCDRTAQAASDDSRRALDEFVKTSATLGPGFQPVISQLLWREHDPRTGTGTSVLKGTAAIRILHVAPSCGTQRLA